MKKCLLAGVMLLVVNATANAQLSAGYPDPTNPRITIYPARPQGQQLRPLTPNQLHPPLGSTTKIDANGNIVSITPPAPIAPTGKMIRLPPPQYDVAYVGKLEILRYIYIEELRAICDARDHESRVVACAERKDHSCTIHLGPYEKLIATGHTFASIMRHELGHCNGWSAQHEQAQWVSSFDVSTPFFYHLNDPRPRTLPPPRPIWLEMEAKQ
jgi:hypothetical protein